jgi:DNA-directed RNA polymerase subunit RPC12/RpoP
MANTPNAIQQSAQLRCPGCGNNTRFFEMMEYVENLVDGNRNHLHLLIGIPHFYQCADCGEKD